MRWQGLVFILLLLTVSSWQENSLNVSSPAVYNESRFVFHGTPRHGTRQVVRLAYDLQERAQVALKFPDKVAGNKLIARDEASFRAELPHHGREMQVAAALIASGALREPGGAHLCLPSACFSSPSDGTILLYRDQFEHVRGQG